MPQQLRIFTSDRKLVFQHVGLFSVTVSVAPLERMIIEEAEGVLRPCATRYLETVLSKLDQLANVLSDKKELYHLLGLSFDYLSFASLIDVDVLADLAAELVEVFEDETRVMLVVHEAHVCRRGTGRVLVDLVSFTPAAALQDRRQTASPRRIESA